MENKKSHLVTASLIGSVKWYLTAPDSVIKKEKGGDGITTWKDKALLDLKNSLGRVKTPFPEAAKRGVDFEKAVYKVASDKVKKGSAQFQAVCESVQGFGFYKKEGVNIDIGGLDCYLYCKYDAIRLPKIIDLKTTASYKTGKYLKTFQHKMYCFVSGADEFEYIVAEWDEFPRVKNVHREFYKVESFELLGKEIFTEVLDAFEVIKDIGLWDTYRTKFCLY